MDGLIVMFLVMYGLWFGEIFILIRFLKRTFDLHKGITDFRVSRKIPIFYIVFSILVAITILTNRYYFMTDSVIPVAQRERNALMMLVLTNLTTPLFWILEAMKRRKIKQLASLSQTEK